jgi:hypothetical protein
LLEMSLPAISGRVMKIRARNGVLKNFRIPLPPPRVNFSLVSLLHLDLVQYAVELNRHWWNLPQSL